MDIHLWYKVYDFKSIIYQKVMNFARPSKDNNYMEIVRQLQILPQRRFFNRIFSSILDLCSIEFDLGCRFCITTY